MSRIIIVVDGGIIQDIQGIPQGITIETRDYDVEGRDVEAKIASENMTWDENGDPHFIGIWEGGRHENHNFDFGWASLHLARSEER